MPTIESNGIYLVFLCIIKSDCKKPKYFPYQLKFLATEFCHLFFLIHIIFGREKWQ